MNIRKIIIPIAALLFLLVGCENGEEVAQPIPMPSPVDASVTPSPSYEVVTPPDTELGVNFIAYENILSADDYKALSEFFPVLLEGEEMQVADAPRSDETWAPQVTTLEGFRKESETMSMYAQPPKVSSFALCDMDRDGEKELILSFDDNIGTYLLLHKSDSGYLGVVLFERWLQVLQTNGVYMGSGGAATISYNRMTFENDAVQTEILANEDGWGEEHKYWIGEEEVSKEEYNTWVADNTPGDEVWY